MGTKTPVPQGIHGRAARVRAGLALGAAPTTVRVLQQLSDRLNELQRDAGSHELSRSEARTHARRAIDTARADLHRARLAADGRTMAVREAARRAEAIVRDRCSRLSLFDLALVKRREAQLAASGRNVGDWDLGAAAERGDHHTLFAAALAAPSIGFRALAAVFANAELNQLSGAAAALRDSTAIDQALAGLDELAAHPEPWRPANIDPSKELVAFANNPGAVTLPDASVPEWIASYVSEEPAPEMPPHPTRLPLAERTDPNYVDNDDDDDA